MTAMTAIIMLFISILAGYFLKLISNYSSEVAVVKRSMRYLTNFIYYGLLPILFAIIFAERGLSLADLSITLVSLFYVLISLIVLWAVIQGVELKFKKAFILTAIFQNTIYLGFPIIMTFYGDISYAAMYALVTMILHLTVGGIMGGGGGIVRTLLSIPILYGFIVGNIIHYTLREACSIILFGKPYVSTLVTYGSAFILGYALPYNITNITRYVKPVLFISFYRIIVSPMIHIVLMIVMRLPIEAFYQLLVESFMPPAITNIIIARVYEWDQELVSTATLVSTLISITVVLGLYWLGILVMYS